MKRLFGFCFIIGLWGCSDDDLPESSRYKVTVDGRANIFIIDDNSNTLIKRVGMRSGRLGVSHFNFNTETNHLYLLGNREYLKVNVLDILNSSAEDYSWESIPYPRPLNWELQASVIDKDENIHSFFRDTNPGRGEIYYQKSSANQLSVDIDLTQEFGIPPFGIEGAYYLEEGNQIILVWYEGRRFESPASSIFIDIDSGEIDSMEFPDIDVVNIFEGGGKKYIVAGDLSHEELSLSLYDILGSELCSLDGVLVQPTFPSGAIRYDDTDSRVEFIERNRNDDYTTGHLQSENCEVEREKAFFNDNETFFVNLYFFNK